MSFGLRRRFGDALAEDAEVVAMEEGVGARAIAGGAEVAGAELGLGTVAGLGGPIAGLAYIVGSRLVDYGADALHHQKGDDVIENTRVLDGSKYSDDTNDYSNPTNDQIGVSNEKLNDIMREIGSMNGGGGGGAPEEFDPPEVNSGTINTEQPSTPEPEAPLPSKPETPLPSEPVVKPLPPVPGKPLPKIPSKNANSYKGNVKSDKVKEVSILPVNKIKRARYSERRNRAGISYNNVRYAQLTNAYAKEERGLFNTSF